MNKLINNLNILAISAVSFGVSTAYAKTSDQDALDTYNQFVMIVKVFDEFEKRDGVYAGHASNKILNLLIAEANAAPGKEGSDCLLAGYLGKVKQYSCKPVDGQNIFDANNNIICSPAVFGAGIVIPRPNDSRWTVACANEVIKRAGLTGKNVDGDVSVEEATKLGKYLRESQGISFANNLNVSSILKKCTGAKDKADCDRVWSIFSSALVNYAPKIEPAAEKTYKDCWKEWTRAGAKFTPKKDVNLSGDFDSLIWMNWLGGCKMRSSDDIESKEKLEHCRVKSGTELSVKNFEGPNIFNLSGTLVCEKEDGGSTIEKSGALTMTCAKELLSKVDFWMIRMMNRNFDLNPACKSDIRSPSEIKLDAEKVNTAK